MHGAYEYLAGQDVAKNLQTSCDEAAPIPRQPDTTKAGTNGLAAHGTATSTPLFLGSTLAWQKLGKERGAAMASTL